MSSVENIFWWSVFSAARATGLRSDKAKRMADDAVLIERQLALEKDD